MDTTYGLMFDPREFVKPTTLADNLAVTFTKCCLVPWNYGKAADVNDKGDRVPYKLTFRSELVPDAGQDYTDPFVNYWTAGNLDHFVPSIDQRTIAGGITPEQAVGLAKAQMSFPVTEELNYAGFFAIPRIIPANKADIKPLNQDTNFYYLLISLLLSGFPVEKLAADVRFLDGVRAHVNRAMPRDLDGREIVSKGTGKDGKEFKRGDVLLVTKLYGAGERAAVGGGGVVGGAPAGIGAPGIGTPAQAQASGGIGAPTTMAPAAGVPAAFGGNSGLGTAAQVPAGIDLGAAEAEIVKYITGTKNLRASSSKLTEYFLGASFPAERAVKAAMVSLVTNTGFMNDPARPWYLDASNGLYTQKPAETVAAQQVDE